MNSETYITNRASPTPILATKKSVTALQKARKVLEYLLMNPYANSVDVASNLNLTPVYVRVIKHRLRKKCNNVPLRELCPNCFSASLTIDQANMICESCGYELPKSKAIIPVETEIYDRRPELLLHPDSNLGDCYDFSSLLHKRVVRTQSVKHYVLPKKEPFSKIQEEALSHLWSLLKGFNFSMDQTNDIAKLLKEEAKAQYIHVQNAKKVIVGRERNLVQSIVIATLQKAEKDKPRLKQALDDYLTLNGLKSLVGEPVQ